MHAINLASHPDRLNYPLNLDHSLDGRSIQTAALHQRSITPLPDIFLGKHLDLEYYLSFAGRIHLVLPFARKDDFLLDSFHPVLDLRNCLRKRTTPRTYSDSMGVSEHLDQWYYLFKPTRFPFCWMDRQPLDRWSCLD